MKGKLLVLILVVLLIGIGVGYFIYQGDFGEREGKEEFTVDTVLLKASIKKSGSFDGKIKITNLKDYPIIVNAKLIDLENVALPLLEFNSAWLFISPLVPSTVRL